MTLDTSDIFSWAVRSWERLLTTLIIGGPVTALTSKFRNPMIIFPLLFGPGRVS